jgi:copper homeostasis protein (lipoprotein)
MARWWWIALAGSLLIGGTCSSNDQMLRGTKWTLKSLNGEAIATIPGAEVPWIMLSAESEQFTGNGGCNSLFGAFTVAGNTFSLGQLGSTKKMCEESFGLEQALMNALRNADAYGLADGVLTLQHQGAVTATFTAAVK